MSQGVIDANLQSVFMFALYIFLMVVDKFCIIFIIYLSGNMILFSIHGEFT